MWNRKGRETDAGFESEVEAADNFESGFDTEAAFEAKFDSQMDIEEESDKDFESGPVIDVEPEESDDSESENEESDSSDEGTALEPDDILDEEPEYMLPQPRFAFPEFKTDLFPSVKTDYVIENHFDDVAKEKQTELDEKFKEEERKMREAEELLKSLGIDI